MGEVGPLRGLLTMIRFTPFDAHSGLHVGWAWMRPHLWLSPWLLAVSLLGYPWLHDIVLGIEITPAERGYRVAVRAGCFNCHGPNGTGGVKNPGSAADEVPGFADGSPMMWVKSESELREYILDGAPARKRGNPL